MYACPLRSRLSSLLLCVPLMAVAATAAHAETTGWETGGWDTDGVDDPTVTILSPVDFAHFGPGPVDVPVEVASTFDGLLAPTVQLEVDNVPLPESCGAAPLCMFTAPLEDGEHILEAKIIEDGFTVASHAITVTVGEEECDTDVVDSGASGATGGDTDGATTGADTGGGSTVGGHDEPSYGCSVSAGASTPAMAGAFFLLGLGALGRRRRR